MVVKGTFLSFKSCSCGCTVQNSMMHTQKESAQAVHQRPHAPFLKRNTTAKIHFSQKERTFCLNLFADKHNAEHKVQMKNAFFLYTCNGLLKRVSLASPRDCCVTIVTSKPILPNYKGYTACMYLHVPKKSLKPCVYSTIRVVPNLLYARTFFE